MNSVPVDQSGLASAINNAMSRLASLLSVAVFGVVLLAGFQHELVHRLDQLALPAQERQSIESQRASLAAVQTEDPRAKRAVAEAFVFGFRRIIWLAVALCGASGLCAQFLTKEPSAAASETHP